VLSSHDAIRTNNLFDAKAPKFTADDTYFSSIAKYIINGKK